MTTRSKDMKSMSVAATHRACFLPLDRKSRVRGSALRRRYASLRVSTPSRYPVSPLPRCCSPWKTLRRSSRNLLSRSFYPGQPFFLSFILLSSLWFTKTNWLIILISKKRLLFFFNSNDIFVILLNPSTDHSI